MAEPEPADARSALPYHLFRPGSIDAAGTASEPDDIVLGPPHARTWLVSARLGAALEQAGLSGLRLTRLGPDLWSAMPVGSLLAGDAVVAHGEDEALVTDAVLDLLLPYRVAAVRVTEVDAAQLAPHHVAAALTAQQRRLLGGLDSLIRQRRASPGRASPRRPAPTPSTPDPRPVTPEAPRPGLLTRVARVFRGSR